MPNINIDFIPAASFSAMGIKIISPPRIISKWVQCFWLISKRQSSKFFFEDKVYPDAGTSLTFKVNNNDDVSASFFHSSRVSSLRWDMLNSYIGVRLKPGGAYALLGLDINEFDNKEIDFNELGSTHKIQISSLLDSLAGLNLQEQLKLLQDWLIVLSYKAAPSHDKMHLLLTQASASLLPPQKIAENNGVGRRNLERYVRQHLGSTPNQLHSYAQIHCARQHLISTSNDMATIALHCGYFDQAHFTNVFRVHTLETPLQYRKRKLSQISN